MSSAVQRKQKQHMAKHNWKLCLNTHNSSKITKPSTSQLHTLESAISLHSDMQILQHRRNPAQIIVQKKMWSDALTFSSVLESFGNRTANTTKSSMCFSTERTVLTEPTDSNSCNTCNTQYRKRWFVFALVALRSMVFAVDYHATMTLWQITQLSKRCTRRASW